jgi:AAA domain, putative AbiEii toxin, Type IV TA system
MPKVLDVEILAPNNRRLNYHYEIVLIPIDEEEINLDLDWPHQESLSWNDSCQYADEQQEKLWETKNGWTDFGKGKEPVTLGNTSSFENYYRTKKRDLPLEMQWVVSVLWGVSIIADTPPNQLSNRASSQLKAIDGIQTASGLADFLTLDILNLQSKQKLPEFESICRRIGLADKITIEKFFRQGSSQEKSTTHISSVSLDNVNIGLLSDGTLRILSILLKIVRSSPTATTIIEEPEMQIHPGMLSKLLNEIESYTFGENLIVSTHSSQVVSWVKPDKINLVYRDDARISVRKLSACEIHRVVEYLNEEGDLGEWLYSGILDE